MCRLFAFLLLSLSVLLPSRGQAQQTCTQTTFQPDVMITWDLPAPQPPGVTVTGIKLERQKDGGAWEALPPLATTVTSFKDTNLAAGTYVYRVSVLGRLANGTTGQSAFAKPGAKGNCVMFTVIVPPSNLEVTAP